MKKRSNEKNSFISIIAIGFSAFFILAGCGSSGGGGSAGRGTTSVSISMKTPPTSGSASGGVSAQAAVPRIISSVVIEVSGEGMSTISRTIAVSPGVTYTETFDVPNGDNRVFNARAYSSDGALLYEAAPQTVDLSGTSVPITLDMILVDVELGLKIGMEALEAGDIVTARDLFRGAVAHYERTNSASLSAAAINDTGSEIAYFFYSFTRVLALFLDMESDAGDIVDFFGCSADGTGTLNFDVVCPDYFEVNNPLNISNFNQNVIAELEGAIGNLADGKVSADFNFRWKEPFGETSVESDYGDALFLRAVFKAAMAAYMVADAYDPNVNIPSGNIETVTMQDFFDINITFPVMTGSPSNSVVWQGGALDDIEAALSEIERELAEDPDQSDDWFTMGDTVDEATREIAEARVDISKVKDCYNNGAYADCQVDDGETDNASDDTKMDFGPYFRDEVHVNTLWPEFAGDDPIGFFPDSSFGGVLTLIKGSSPSALDANEDVKDGDGNADIFQSKLNYVYGGTVEGPMNFNNACKDPVGYYDFALAGAAVTVDGDATFTGAVNYDYYVIKFESKDLGFFSDLVHPDIYLDAIEFLDVDSSSISYFYQEWTNFDLYYITGPEDGLSYWIDSKRSCIIVDNSGLLADKVKVYTVQ